MGHRSRRHFPGTGSLACATFWKAVSGMGAGPPEGSFSGKSAAIVCKRWEAAAPHPPTSIFHKAKATSPSISALIAYGSSVRQRARLIHIQQHIGSTIASWRAEAPRLPPSRSTTRSAKPAENFGTPQLDASPPAHGMGLGVVTWPLLVCIACEFSHGLSKDIP